MAPQIPLYPSTSTPNYQRSPAAVALPTASLSVPTPRRPPPPPPPKLIEIISIHSTTETALPWSYTPDQFCFKINNTIYLLAMDVDSEGTPVNVSWLFTRFNKHCYDYSVIGTCGRTRFEVGMLGGLGKAGIESFGTPQSVWWNIQTFLNHYLGLITEGKFKPITTPSSILRTITFASTFGLGPQPRLHKEHKELVFEPTSKSKELGIQPTSKTKELGFEPKSKSKVFGFEPTSKIESEKEKPSLGHWRTTW